MPQAFHRPQLPKLPPSGNPGAGIVGYQPISCAEGRIEAPIYDRARRGAGDHIGAPGDGSTPPTLLLLGLTAEAHSLRQPRRVRSIPARRQLVMSARARAGLPLARDIKRQRCESSVFRTAAERFWSQGGWPT